MESTDRDQRLQDIWCRGLQSPSASYAGVQFGFQPSHCYACGENESYNAEVLRDSFPAMAAVVVGS